MNDPAAFNGHVQTNLLLALENWARARPGRGSTVFPRDVAIDEHNVFNPDSLRRWCPPVRIALARNLG